MNDDTKKFEGRAKGGAARQASLTPEQRSENARKAAIAKAELAKLPKPTHVGTLKIGDAEIPCAVLPDGRRVLSQRGVMSAIERKYGSKDFQLAAEIGSEYGGGNFPVYLAVSSLRPFIDAELAAVVSSPIKYVDPTANLAAFGLDAALLPKILDVWLKARDEGRLPTSAQRATAAKADMLMRGLAHVGIIALVDEATGYQKDRAKNDLAKILEAFVAKELQPWIKTFPADYYEQLFRLYGYQFPPEGRPQWRPQFFGKITNEVVYDRLAPNLLPELKKAATKAERKARLHQMLTTDIGHPRLREHLASIVTLLKLSRTPKEFRDLVDRIHPRFGETVQFDFDIPERDDSAG